MSQAGAGAHVWPSGPVPAGPRLVVAALALHGAVSGLCAGGQDRPGGMTVTPQWVPQRRGSERRGSAPERVASLSRSIRRAP